MHELSIMMSILETCQTEAKKAQAAKIKKIHLQIGERSGVVVDSLQFVFDMAIHNTMAEGATLEIESIPLEGECRQCHHRFYATEGFLVCNQCGAPGDVIHGQELNISRIEIEEATCVKTAVV